MGEIDQLNMTKLAQNNEYLMERLSQNKEVNMKKMRASFGTSDFGRDTAAGVRAKANSLESRPSPKSAENRQLMANSIGTDFDLEATINQRLLEENP